MDDSVPSPNGPDPSILSLLPGLLGSKQVDFAYKVTHSHWAVHHVSPQIVSANHWARTASASTTARVLPKLWILLGWLPNPASPR